MPDMTIGADTIEAHIPYYLTKEQKEGLTKALKDFYEHPTNYYINQHMDEMLQGDGWAGLQVIRFDNGERKNIKGIILSNSCDISTENKRELPVNIAFAPIIKLSNYAAVLKQSGLNDKQIDSKFESIKKQNITNVFYLPSCGTLDDDYIALLGDLHSIPSHAFDQIEEREKHFTLSMIGFYIFVLKLSVHFCRLHEDVSR